MADQTLSSHIVTDPQTLLGTTRAIAARIVPQAGLRGNYASLLIEQLRLLFIDTRKALFVFGGPDQTVLTQANNYARTVLENALEEIFKEKTRLELVLFDESQDPLPDLIARFTEEPLEEAPNKREAAVESPALQVKTIPAAPPIQTEEKAPGLNTVQLGLLQNSLRDVFTSPKRVVVVPGYLLRWIPYIGPLRTSIVVACFQAFYHSRGTTAKANLTFEAPGPFLAAVAGIAESSIWRHLDDPELGCFLKKVPYRPDENRWIRDERAGLTKRRPTRFLFRSTAPLTPGDAGALLSYLTDLDIQDSPVEVLTELVRGQYRVEPRDIFPFPPPPPPKDWQAGNPDDCLIHNVIFTAIGIEAKSAPKNLTSLVDELVERLLPANDQVHISWYYLLHWLPLLGHGPGWATILLRDRCYYNRQTGELRDTVNLHAGYQELANALGLMRTKTVREWFPVPGTQKEAAKSANLSSREILEGISLSKRSFVRQYAAKFAEVAEAEADGRGQVSSFKARVRLFDPLTPLHEALYTTLFPLVQACFALPKEHRAAFLNAFEETSALDEQSIKKIIQESNQAAEEILGKLATAVQPGVPCSLEEPAITDFLGAIERITASNLGVNRSITPVEAGAIERVPAGDLGGFEKITALILGAIERVISDHPGAFERFGCVFWAHMRGLKYMVLNNHLDESLREYLQNTGIENSIQITSTTTAESEIEESEEDEQRVDVGRREIIKKWDRSQLLNNFSPHIKRELLEKDLAAEALVSCLLYIASSKGNNLGLGYVVDKLKWNPQEGQGGIYRRLAEEPPEEIIDRLESYLEYRSFRNRDWRVAMGSPTAEKILELLEHLGIDSSRFGRREEWG